MQHTVRSHFAGSLFAVVVGNKVHVNSLSMAAVITDSSVEIAAVTEKLGAYAVVNFICTQLDLQQLKGSIVAKLTCTPLRSIRNPFHVGG